MLRLTRFGNRPFVVNVGTIAYIDEAPDTYITLTTGERLHVRESVDEIVAQALAWQQCVAAGPPQVVDPDQENSWTSPP